MADIYFTISLWKDV